MTSNIGSYDLRHFIWKVVWKPNWVNVLYLIIQVPRYSTIVSTVLQQVSLLEVSPIFLPFSKTKELWFMNKTFQIRFGVSRFTLEWLHCLHWKIIVDTENKFPPIISFMYNQCALKINWCTLKTNQSIKYLHIYQCTLLLEISVHLKWISTKVVLIFTARFPVEVLSAVSKVNNVLKKVHFKKVRHWICWKSLIF